MQALAAGELEIGVPRGLVMPGLVGRTGFQRAEDMHQTRLAAALGYDGLDAIFLAKVFLVDVLNREAVGLGQALGVSPNLVPQRFGKARVIEDADAVRITDSASCL